ncbi:hypothetical protein BDN71DRAFT_1428362 [Pleurotus eryngii]|uniref:Uncharacterized protein n=1 Tax=Pleurotus eryngii TaxID=5323 RepID=A0A9P6DII8_PLEER|nr:hypothetical protein BDN71DRAFT_1428362 [Pleurotus eryngii]
MPMNAIPFFSYNQLNVRPLGPQAAAWEQQIPLQLIVDYTDHQFLDILLAMRRSWDMVPIALLHRELEYVLGTIGASVALGHILIVTIAQCLEAWEEQLSESEDGDSVHCPLSLLLVWSMAQAAIPIISPPCDQCTKQLNILVQMMSILEVAMNDRMMAITADRQEMATLFDIYEAIIYKEADHTDEAETQQNTTELDNEIQCIVDDNKPAPKHKN